MTLYIVKNGYNLLYKLLLVTKYESAVEDITSFSQFHHPEMVQGIVVPISITQTYSHINKLVPLNLTNTNTKNI